MSQPYDMLHHGIFINDAVRPEQWWGRRALDWDAESIRELWAALITDAVACLREGAFSKRRDLQIEHERARIWFFEDRAYPHGLRFEEVAIALGHEPDAIRAALARHERAKYATRSVRRPKIVSLAGRYVLDRDRGADGS